MNNQLYNIEVETIDGKTITLKEFQGKVLLIVNVASRCGFTPQYKALQTLYEEYHAEGFEVLGFPCNQFLFQEPGNSQYIKDFCTLNYDVTFPMFAKIKVNGKHTNLLYQYLKDSKPGTFGTKFIKWNFTKFLVNSNGDVVKRYSPLISPYILRDDIELQFKGTRLS